MDAPNRLFDIAAILYEQGGRKGMVIDVLNQYRPLPSN